MNHPSRNKFDNTHVSDSPQCEITEMPAPRPDHLWTADTVIALVAMACDDDDDANESFHQNITEVAQSWFTGPHHPIEAVENCGHPDGLREEDKDQKRSVAGEGINSNGA